MQRSTRKLNLTAAGQEFFDLCAPAVDGLLEAGKALVRGSQHPSGSVRIAAPVDFLDLFRIEWVAQFLALHPQVRLDFVLSDARADLIGEAIDVAFRGATMQDTDATIRLLMPQYFSLVASPAYLTSRGEPKSVRELAAHDCLTVSNRQGRAIWALLGPHGRENVTVTGRFSANSARVLLNGCLAGLGIALMPTLLIIQDINAGRLVHVLPDYRREGADFHVVLPSRRQIPTAVSAFVEFAAERLQVMVADQLRKPASTRRQRRSPK